MFRTLAIAAALSAAVSTTAPAQTLNAGEQRAAADQTALRQEALARIRANRQGITVKLRDALASNDAAALAQARAAYRQSVTAELLIDTAGLDPAARLAAVQTRAAEAAERWRRMRQTARDHLVNRLGETANAAEREKIFDSAADMLDAARAEMEMTAEAARRLDPMGQANDAQVNRTQLRLRELLDRITSNYVEEPLRPSYGREGGRTGGAPQNERDAEHWLRQREREADVAEYVRLARGGIFIDPSTGLAIEGTERQRIARNAEQQLIEALRRANLDEGVLSTLMGFADTRGAVAAERAADIAASDEYRALDFITPSLSGAKTQEVFRALAVAVRREQDRINSWRAARVPEGGNGGVTGWLYENFVAKQKVGLGRASEIGGWGLTTDSLDQIDRRIAIFQRDADAVVAAFAAAAQTADPKDLLATPQGRAQHRLLEQYGYIARDANGNETFRIPTDARVSQRVGATLNLPGASWLDIISGANVMKLVVLAAAPELAAARFGALLESLELGAGVVRIGVFVTESLAGSALDAGINLATGEKVDVERMAIESLFLAPVLQAAGRAAGEASSALATVLKDRARRRVAEAFLTQTLGLASETALQTYWQSQLQGKVTYEDFLSNLVNGAISRGARSALDRAASARDAVTDSTQARRRPDIPDALAPVFEGADGRRAREETIDRAAENQRRFNDADRTLREIVGSDLAHPDAATRIVTALEEGRYAWADLKMLYRDSPARFTPLMAAANAARARFAQAIVSGARLRAREQIDAEHRANAARLTGALRNDPAQLKDALAQNDTWRQQQLDLVGQDPFAPGSKDLTSDIDRSVASPYFRNALKELADFQLGALGAIAPTSARAYDLNEYIDVFPIIRRTRGLDLSAQSPPGFRELTHQQAVEAISLSSAMLHMTPAQRAHFKDNVIRSARPEDVARTKLQFGYAEESLRRGERDLKTEIDRLVALGADRSSHDTVTRARDNLYGQRTQRLHDLEYQLSRVQPGSDEARRLAAEIEREWSFTLREGIETYSTFAGLDAIVIRGQLVERSIRDLITDPKFNAREIGMSPEQARAMLNDQTLMIVEHVRAYQEGHESLRDAAAALAKYTERAVLGLKLLGADLSAADAARLNDLADRLMKVRKDPEALEKVLAEIGGNDAAHGLDLLIAAAQNAMPGLDGIFDPSLQPAARPVGTTPRADVTTPEGMARARSLLAVQREREQEAQRARVYYGDGSAAHDAAERLAADRAELATLKDDKARTDRLGQTYNRNDWRRAEELESAKAAIARQIALLPSHTFAGGIEASLRQQMSAIDQQLTALGARRNGTVAPTDEEVIRDRRITVLEREIPQQERDMAAHLKAAEAEQRALQSTPIDREARSPFDAATATEFERAGALLFGNLDRDAILGRDTTPHQEMDRAITPRDPSAPAGSGAAAPSNTIGSIGGGGSSVPPIDFHIYPGVLREDETFVDLDAGDLFLMDPGFKGVLTDPSTQHMISIVDFTRPVTIQGRAPEPAPEEAVLQSGQTRVFITSLGTSTGEALDIHIVNDGDKAVRIRGNEAIVLEPLNPAAIPQAQRAIRDLPDARTLSAKLSAYCLEFTRKPPSSGMVFRVANEQVQQRFAEARKVLDAAKKLEQLGVLKPDGNPAAYFHAIRQWAIWTKEQRFDAASFGRAFVERTKQNFAALGQAWTREIETAVAARVPGRWADITRVLAEAER